MGTERKVQKTKAAQPQRKPVAKQSERGARSNASGLANLQQQVGNRAVQLLVAQRSGGQEAYTLDEQTAGRIKQERGAGQPLEDAVQAEMGQAMGRDLSGVRVHTDAEADRLNRQVDARAFTVGNDVFFRRGEYTPHSSEGKELLAHELTHVVDQSEGRVKESGSGMTVHAPDDAYEQKADAVAKRVASPQPVDRARPSYAQSEGMSARAVQRQDEPEELETKAIQRQDEEEELEAKTIQRQDEPEEELETQSIQRQDEPEELETKAVQRQDEEEELEAKTIQRQDEPEEELETKSLQRQDEEELEAKTIQRQDEPEEELETQSLQRQEPEEELETKHK